MRPKRAFGRSTHTVFANLWWAKKAIFSFTFLPIEALGYAAAAMTALSCLALAYQGWEVWRHPGTPTGSPCSSP